MKKFIPVVLAIVLTLSALSVRPAQAAPAEPPIPGGRQLVALLSGPAIDGVTPEGKAEFVALQSGTVLGVRASNLNLPHGTCLDVAFGRTTAQGTAVVSGSAFASLSPSPEQIRPGELITISIGEPPVGQSGCIIILGEGVLSPATGTVLAPATGTVILSGTFQDGGGTK